MLNPLFLGSSCALSASLRYIFFGLFFSFLLSSGSHAPHDPAHLVFVIESNPANLDPRYAPDAQSQRIDRLLFDGLVGGISSAPSWVSSPPPSAQTSTAS